MIRSVPHMDEQSLENISRYFKPFLDMNRQEIKELMSYCEVRHFSKKEVIVDEGTIDNYLNIVIAGLVRKFIRVSKREETLQLATEGHVIHSEISFLQRKPSEVILQALEPTTVVSMSYESMMSALEKFPKGERLGRMILSRMYVKKNERISIKASLSAKERFVGYIQKNPHMLKRVPQKFLASYLHIKPETFSRLKQFVKNNKGSNLG